jgi:hypothetical protein
MAKLIPLSIVLFMAIVPIALATRPAPRRTLRIIQILTLVAVLLWALACRRWYPELVPAE